MLAVINTPAGATPVEQADLPQPQPAPDEVVVAVRAFSINRGELGLLERRPHGWRPGQDVAGVVTRAAQTEDGAAVGVGTRVVGLVEQQGWAEQVAIPLNRLAPLPDTVAFEDAAALPIAGITALRTLRLAGNVGGRSLLVTGATGALGRFQIELGAHSGAEVTAVSGRRDQHRALVALGATHVVADIEEAGGPFDVISEQVGGRSLQAAIARIAPGGLIVLVGNTTKTPSEISFGDFFGRELARIQTFFSYASPDPVDRDLATLVALVAGDRLHPHRGFTRPWEHLAEALESLRTRAITGKAVLTIPG